MFDDYSPCYLCDETGLTPEGIEISERILASGHKVPERAIARRHACPRCGGDGQASEIQAKKYYHDYVYSD